MDKYLPLLLAFAQKDRNQPPPQQPIPTQQQQPNMFQAIFGLIKALSNSQFDAQFLLKNSLSRSKLQLPQKMSLAAQLSQIVYEDIELVRKEAEKLGLEVVFSQLNTQTFRARAQVVVFRTLPKTQGAKHLFICFRGSKTMWDWYTNIRSLPQSVKKSPELAEVSEAVESVARTVGASMETQAVSHHTTSRNLPHHSVQLHRGFFLNLVRDGTRDILQKLIESHPDDEVIICGHSLGGASAITLHLLLVSALLGELGEDLKDEEPLSEEWWAQLDKAGLEHQPAVDTEINKACNACSRKDEKKRKAATTRTITTFSFGAPLVLFDAELKRGKRSWCHFYSSLFQNIHCVVHSNDVVPRMLGNAISSGVWDAVGTILELFGKKGLDSSNTPESEAGFLQKLVKVTPFYVPIGNYYWLRPVPSTSAQTAAYEAQYFPHSALDVIQRLLQIDPSGVWNAIEDHSVKHYVNALNSLKEQST